MLMFTLTTELCCKTSWTIEYGSFKARMMNCFIFSRNIGVSIFILISVLVCFILISYKYINKIEQ